MAICVLTEKEGIMEETKLTEIMELKDRTLLELKARYKELYSTESVPSSNKVYLWRKIAYRIQELEHGGLSSEVQGKIEEFIHKYDPVNNKSLRPTTNTGRSSKKPRLSRDKRLPIPGTVITKEYKGISLKFNALRADYS